MPQLLVFSEQSELLCEMLGKARQMADDMLFDSVVAAGWGDATVYAQHGADKVLLFDELPESQAVEDITPSLIAAARDSSAEIVMIGCTKHGREIAARLAAAIDAPCVTDSLEISVDSSSRQLSTSHVVYGGQGIQKDVFQEFPLVVTVSPRRFQKEVNPRTVLVESPVAPTPGRVKVLERKQDPISDVNVSEADVVLCVGRGLAKQEDLALIEELAESIGGVIGCTRPISEDYSWLPTDRYIGLSGQKVQPKLYIALGSSGQIQHIAGCRDAKTIVAIDKDESAPIWEASDYGIVGDLYEIVPALIQELTKR